MTNQANPPALPHYVRRLSVATLVKGIGALTIGLALFVVTLMSAAGSDAAHHFKAALTALLLFLVGYGYPAWHALHRRHPDTWKIVLLVLTGIASIVVASTWQPHYLLPSVIIALLCWAAGLALAAFQLDPTHPLHHYAGLEDRRDTVWSDLVPVIDSYVTDDAVGALGNSGKLAWLNQLALKHGADTLLATLHTHIGGHCSHELQWFARVGIREALPYIRRNFTSHDLELRCYAALQLAHLGEQDGFDFIEQALSGGIDFDVDDADARFYFDGELTDIDDERAREIRRKYGVD